MRNFDGIHDNFRGGHCSSGMLHDVGWQAEPPTYAAYHPRSAMATATSRGGSLKSQQL